ncbi:OmpA family protein [Novosphingobium sp. 1949]|uniref:OmpA family protein n=1 Tax=Novosphingobium organovorum TaxID=2930092 RepID=A0ABT0BIR2_9SPHN|nr:OmpA family protein [Novosphingobium organovorum]MCJ2184711.1 OmpA family protein [Novosphingobium organovorum]
MNPRNALVASAGAALCLILSAATMRFGGPAFVDGLARKATAVRDAAGGQSITLAFKDRYGWLTRHPILSGGAGLSAETRREVAARVAAVPGIGGISWASSRARAEAPESLHCQSDVERILETRTIRFTEASARLDPASGRLLDEVARALRPCVGSIIAVTGHTDAGGNAEVNKALSLARAEAVRWALIGRGIPADGLRAAGVGATHPIAGLDPADPANRRIEFSVIVSAPVKPTPIDTPGPG